MDTPPPAFVAVGLPGLARWYREAESVVSYARARLAAWRAPLIGVSLVVFAAGAYWSFHDLAISPGQLHAGPLALLALLVIPSLLYGGLGLVLLARTCGARIPLGKATRISAYAYLAELLPLPGGAIVRTAALVEAGSALPRSASMVLLTAILWVALAMIGGGVALVPFSITLALPLAFVGGACTLGIMAWLWRVAGARLALMTLLHRAFGIALTAVRLQVAFAALGTSIGLVETFPFVLALLLGSASSIAPAGLGISESLAALAATTSHFLPGIAFLSVALDRLMCLAGCAALAVAGYLSQSWRARSRPLRRPIAKAE